MSDSERDVEAADEFDEFLDDLDGSDGADRLDGLDVPADVVDAGAGAEDAIIEPAVTEQPLTEVEELTIEVNEFKNMALRLQADFENYRKRVSAQRADEIDRATGKLAEAMLAVLDACEAAFAHGVEGIEPIWSQLMGVLHKEGLEALDLVDKPFDPAHADAVLHEPSGDDAPVGPVVTEVLRTGYTWKGKTLRAAMVKVRG